MGKITFILGGVRSGKSQMAIKMAKKKNGKVAFIATCVPMDKEMKKRVSMHRKARPAHWQTFEEPEDIHSLLRKIDNKFDIIIIDCLTILVSNMLLKNLKDKDIEEKINQTMFALKRNKAEAIIVSNEVGMGIVPDNKLAREFRDIAGKINQITAKKSDEVFFMISGLPLSIKKENK